MSDHSSNRSRPSFLHRLHGIRLVVFVLCAAASLAIAQRSRDATPTTAPSAAREDFASQFGVLADRNIFVKSRTPPVRRDDRPAPSTSPARVPTAEESLVLRGVVIEDDASGAAGQAGASVLRAYFEDQRTRTLTRVTAGDALAKGHVVDVSIDAIAFENQGNIVWVRIGDNLLGERSNNSGNAGNAGTSSTTTSPSDGTGTPSAPLSEVERRMRERRQRNQ
jgi:hypothetical protein